ncbi:MAG: CPBP family intramembrane glutamic endopeptidase [Vicinamibacterales bacterium]
MSDLDSCPQPDSPPLQVAAPSPGRLTAVFEILLCSGFPTQFVLGALLILTGLGPLDGSLTLSYVVTLSLLDTVALIGLILFVMRAHGEHPGEVFFGRRPIRGEVMAGLPLAFVALALAAVALTALHELAPWLRTYARNPFQDLVQSTGDLVIFGLTVVIAGGIREEIQRAFLLTRFEQSLGGMRTGVAVTSIAFGAGHFVQGADATVATALLGAFWAVVYVRRRSVVAPVVSHSLFNLTQLAQLAIIR